MAKNDGKVRERQEKRRDAAASEPNKTLFVAGFHSRDTRTRDLEKAFEEFGRLKRCDLRGSFAFIEFERLEDAVDAVREMHGAKINGKEMTVEYCMKEGKAAAAAVAGYVLLYQLLSL
jgi:arginine/serine-rich splicing factor 4/5/6